MVLAACFAVMAAARITVLLALLWVLLICLLDVELALEFRLELSGLELATLELTTAGVFVVVPPPEEPPPQPVNAHAVSK